MLNKLYEWVNESSVRNGVPAVEPSHTDRPDGDDDSRMRRKRRFECLADGHVGDQNERTLKKSRMGDLIDTVKIAAEGLKNRSSSVATWMKTSVSPTLRNILPAFSGRHRLELQPPTSSAASWTPLPVSQVSRDADVNPTFAAPVTTLEWKTPRSVCRRHVHISTPHQEGPKINGHPCSSPTTVKPDPAPSARLGRPINRKYAILSGAPATSGSCGSMYDKTFPIKVAQRPSLAATAGHVRGAKARCTAQESILLEEKEAYRQLLTMVSAGHSCLFNGHSPTVVRSQRDFTSFLSPSRRLLHLSSFAASATGDSSEEPSSPLGNGGVSSRSSSNLPSPASASYKTGNSRAWSADADLSSGHPSPSAVLDSCSRDTHSSAHDDDSVIIVNEKKSKKSMPCFQAELWIKELSSIYDSRARERRRRIEEQEALTARLQRQRLSEGGQRATHVELHVRVPLEKEIPLTFVIQKSEALEDKPEFPELTEEMEAQVDRVLRRGSSDEVFSEGFGLSLTRKDLQTLCGLSWLNDEVINFYMNLLVERSKSPKLPSVNTFSTFFYPKLRSSGYSAVRRWTKKMDIFSKDILLVPVHLSMHWCLSVVDFRKKAITYFDSMGGNNDEACKLLFDYLQQESKDKKGKELDTSGWSLRSKKRNEIPQQMNGSDCGMFTCKYADYITKDRPITFTQKQMPYFRRRMVWEIVNRKLL
ncbi:sentrin-specific protease 1 [Syngnathus acus]|uniref:sentrin-specific protease 1 n=1 Tax=Syngnathus acus TaxID=161584 RepID=UPI0018860492|nr:sentrin-specific protease 1 [Syngnathus acus]